MDTRTTPAQTLPLAPSHQMSLYTSDECNPHAFHLHTVADLAELAEVMLAGLDQVATAHIKSGSDTWNHLSNAADALRSAIRHMHRAHNQHATK